MMKINKRQAEEFEEYIANVMEESYRNCENYFKVYYDPERQGLYSTENIDNSSMPESAYQGNDLLIASFHMGYWSPEEWFDEHKSEAFDYIVDRIGERYKDDIDALVSDVKKQLEECDVDYDDYKLKCECYDRVVQNGEELYYDFIECFYKDFIRPECNAKNVVLENFEVEPYLYIKNGILVNYEDGYDGYSAEIVIPDSVKEIGKWAFSGCTTIKSVIISSGVTGIGNNAFCDCSSLKNVSIPESVEKIGKGAFSGCSSLESVNIPKGVTEIGKWAFSGCSSLKSVVIPESVTEIEPWVFNRCKNLKKVEYAGTAEQWEKLSVKLPEGCKIEYKPEKKRGLDEVIAAAKIKAEEHNVGKKTENEQGMAK